MQEIGEEENMGLASPELHGFDWYAISDGRTVWYSSWDDCFIPTIAQGGSTPEASKLAAGISRRCSQP